jgi:hypothetical protein
MGDRVLATQAALKTAVDVRGRVRDLQAAAQQVMVLSDQLASPEVWDGQSAAQFRQVQWPNARTSLLAGMQTLDRVRSSAETVIREILVAGSQGRLDSPPPPPTGHPQVQMPTTGSSNAAVFAAGALVLGADLELGGAAFDGTIFGAPVGVVLGVAGGVVLAAAAVAGIISLFANKQQPPQLSADEQQAVANHDAGLPYDKKAYKKAIQKINQGQKFQDERNTGKQRGQPKK